MTPLAHTLREAIFAKTGYRMSIESIKAALLHIPGIESLAMQYGGGGTPDTYRIGALRVSVPAKASVQEAIAAISLAVAVPGHGAIAAAAVPASPSPSTSHVTPLPAAPVISSAPPSAPASTGVSMSITGLQEGVFAGKLAELKAKIADAQTAGLAKIDGAKASALAKVDERISAVTAKVDAEVDAALAEFATFTNGGPA